MAMVRLVSGGMVSRKACGSDRVEQGLTIATGRSSARLPTGPRGIEVMPAQKISSEKAISTKASDSQVETKPEGDGPA